MHNRNNVVILIATPILASFNSDNINCGISYRSCLKVQTVASKIKVERPLIKIYYHDHLIDKINLTLVAAYFISRPK